MLKIKIKKCEMSLGLVYQYSQILGEDKWSPGEVFLLSMQIIVTKRICQNLLHQIPYIFSYFSLFINFKVSLCLIYLLLECTEDHLGSNK